MRASNSYRTGSLSGLVAGWWSTILTALLATICGFGIVWVYLLIDHEVSRDTGAIRHLNELDNAVIHNHLWLEEYIAGDDTFSREQIEAKFAEASVHIDSISADIFHDSPVNLILEPAVIDGLFSGLRDRLTDLESKALARLTSRSPLTADAGADDDFDAAYHDFRAALDNFKSGLESEITQSNDFRRQIIYALFAVWALLALLTVFSAVRREKRRLATQAALHQSENRFRDLVNLLPTGIFEVDQSGTVMYANERMLKMCGVSREQLESGISYESVIADDDLHRAQSDIAELLRTGATTVEKYYFKRSDSTFFPAIVHASASLDGGRPVGFRGVVSDISEQEETEQALRHRKEEYQTLMRVAPVGIFRIDPDGRCTYLSERGSTLLEMHFEQASGYGWTDSILPEDRDRIVNAFKAAAQERSPLAVEGRHRRADDSIVWLYAEAVPEFDENGRLLSYIGTIMDTTVRKTAEAAVRESKDRFRRLAEAASEGILIHEKGVCLDTNSAFARMVGVTPKDLIGQNVMQFIHDDYSQKVVDNITDGYEKPYEVIVVRKDGTTFPAQLHGRNVQSGGRHVRVVAVRDLTDEKQAEQEIQKFKTIIDIAEYGSAISDLDYNFVYVNDHYARMHGYEPAELIGQHVSVCRDLDRLPDLTHQLDDCVKSGSHGTKEVWHRRKDGTVFPGLQTALVVHDPHGKPMYLAATIIDITEMKENERKLKQLAAFPENNPNLVLTIDSDGTVLYANPSARKLTNESAHSNGLLAYLPENASELIQKCLKTGQAMIDLERLTTDSIWTWALHPVEGENFVHCYGRDVTDRKRNEQELRKLSAAVDQSANIVVITDTEGTIEYVNPHFTKITGYSPEEAVGQPARILRSGRHDRAFYEELWKKITSGEIWFGRMQNRRKNGELYWERKTITPITDAEGRITNYLSVAEDITLELYAQQKVAESDKMSAVGMLAAGVAHEFKNYLGGIIGNASFALDELENGENDLALARDTLSQIIEMGDRANDVAMSLLSYSKAKPDDFGKEDLSKIILKSLGLVEKEMRNVSIEVVTYVEELPKVLVSASKIQQLLLNLLINAQHAIGSDGVITVSLIRAEDHARIIVADTGSGIPEENITKIFDPFYSTKGVWGKDELVGTGMGLSICRNIAREHGGDLTVESIVGMGTAFTLTIPIDEKSGTTPVLKNSLSTVRLLLFTLDRGIVKQYFAEAARMKTKLLWVDAAANVGDTVSRVADLVICDARFTGKVELFRLVEMCNRDRIPFVLINCGVMEYQLADLYDCSRANFKQAPALDRVLSCGLKNAPTSPEDAMETSVPDSDQSGI